MTYSENTSAASMRGGAQQPGSSRQRGYLAVAGCASSAAIGRQIRFWFLLRITLREFAEHQGISARRGRSTRATNSSL